ncbi:hypothetical protein RMCBS344292_10985 [Rhizopus microsporus]|nr:hypothetical protein RMCBS344292_10985 [Rhizopus microsporus]
MEELFLPVAVDPGRKTVFTATITHSEDRKEYRSCSSKERRSFAGVDRRTQKVLKLKKASGVEGIESQIPTPKTIDLDRMKQHIGYMLNNIESLFRFYNFLSAPFRFYAYQGTQRANAEMANILLNGGKKYNKSKRRKTNRNKRRKRRKRKSRSQEHAQTSTSNYVPKESNHKSSKFEASAKVPVVVFGDGLKNKENVPMKGQLSGTSGVVQRSLYQRSKQLTAAIVQINEYNTSKVCSSCKKKDLEKVKLENGIEFFGILVCKNCGILWNRDINASKNMAYIAASIWNGDGRPSIFEKSENRRQGNGAPLVNKCA